MIDYLRKVEKRKKWIYGISIIIQNYDLTIKIGEKMKNLTNMTVTVLAVIAILCVSTISAEVVFEDTFENVPNGSGINIDIDASGRQSGTIAPTNYGVTSISAIINGGVLEQVGDPVGKSVAANYNFTDLNENFVVECDVQKDNNWLGLVVGSSAINGTDGDRINFWVDNNSLFLFENNVQHFSKVIPTDIVDMNSNMHCEIVVANASYGGSDNPRISLFINGNALTIYDMGAGYWGYTRESPINLAQNYIDFSSYAGNTSYWDNLKIRNSDVTMTTSQWLDDSDLDLDSSRNYTHAVNLNASANVTINGVIFEGSPTNQESGTDWEIIEDVNTTPDSDWVVGANNADTQITGAGTNLINGYVIPRWSNGGYLKLTGLPPGNIGTFEMYSIAKLRVTLPNDRANYFATSVGGQYEADQNLYNEGTGMVQKVQYIVPESGSITIAITPLVNSGGQTVRWYAFSNWTIPEPGIVGLLALAGLAFLRRK